MELVRSAPLGNKIWGLEDQTLKGKPGAGGPFPQCPHNQSYIEMREMGRKKLLKDYAFFIQKTLFYLKGMLND